MVSAPATQLEPTYKTLPKSNRYDLLFLLSVVSIFFLVIFFVPHDIRKGDSAFDQLGFYSDESAMNFQIYYDRALRSEGDKRGNDLAKAFLILSVDYSSNPFPQKREVLEDMLAYLKTNYPKIVQEQRLTIPCYAASCGAIFSYSENLEKIKEKIESLEIDGLWKQSLLTNLENVALAAGQGQTDAQYASLGTLLIELIELRKANGGPNLDTVIGLVTDDLKSLDPERYEQELSRNFYGEKI